MALLCPKMKAKLLGPESDPCNLSGLSSPFTPCPSTPGMLTHHAHRAGSLSLSQAIVTSLEKLALPQGLENCLGAKSVLMPPYPFVYIGLCHFCATPVELNCGDGDCLLPYRKGLLTPALESHSTWDTVTLYLDLPYPLDCEHLKEGLGNFKTIFYVCSQCLHRA